MPASFSVNSVHDAQATEVLTVTTSVTGTTAATRVINTFEAEYALISVESGTVYWLCIPGVSASSGTGHSMTSGGSIELRGANNVAKFTATTTAGGTAKLVVTYAV